MGKGSARKEPAWSWKQPVIEVVNTVTTRESGPFDSFRHGKRTKKLNINNWDDDGPQYVGPTRDATSIIIHSNYLKNALRAVVAYYPDFHFSPRQLSIYAPYYELYHHRHELAAYSNNQPSSHDDDCKTTTSRHIEVLLQYLATTFGSEFDEEEERHKLRTPVTTFAWLWTLFKPGQLVYAKKSNSWSAYIVSGFSTPRTADSPLDIFVWYVAAHGDTLSRKMTKFTVNSWEGEVPISSLSVLPEPYWTEDLQAQSGEPGKPLRETLIEEGKMLWELLKEPTSKHYKGELLYDGEEAKDIQRGRIEGRVICDSSGFVQYCEQKPEVYEQPRRRCRSPGDYENDLDMLPQMPPHCGCPSCRDNRQENSEKPMFHEFIDLVPATDEPPKNDLFYLVCNRAVPGFILPSRRWGIFKIANLSDIKPDKDAFKYLVLDDKIKRTVKALIGRFAASVHNKVAPWANDFIKNKGEGRIFLLHGQPGVGKTSTAECIAELANRPLIALTSGDLLTSLDDVEKNLSYFLTLGQRYGALVLLDECDIYLERRTASDIDRNGLVSIFLRALEYYRGVLFLTTNRVQSFDTAFLSRIHVALHYKNLTNENRERIWTHTFERLARDSDSKVHVSAAARDYVLHHADVEALQWNGREIRNAMQTALALAESEAHDEGDETVCVRVSHLEAVVEMSSSFKGYVGGLKGRDGCEGENV